MSCRFRGVFTEEERERIEQATERFERAYFEPMSVAPTWAFVNFTASYQGASYWGVRIDNGFMVKAQTGKGLAMAVDTAREEELRRRSRTLRRESQSVSRAFGE